jgi:hypothetical protein
MSLHAGDLMEVPSPGSTRAVGQYDPCDVADSQMGRGHPLIGQLIIPYARTHSGAIVGLRTAPHRLPHRAFHRNIHPVS